MHKINEVLGRIEGIDFDGVINDMEVARLRSLTEKNRNLIYDSRQAKIIALIDRILEDNIITDDEADLFSAGHARWDDRYDLLRDQISDVEVEIGELEDKFGM